jgi:CRP/FNR family transcriptional regulator
MEHQISEVKATNGSGPADAASVPAPTSLLRLAALEYPAGTVLSQQGSLPGEVVTIERGIVKLIRLNEYGQKTIVGLRSRGSVLGAASIIMQRPHPVTVVTMTACSLRRIPLKMFLELARTDPKLSWYLHQAHSREAYEQVKQMTALRNLSVRQRLEQLIRDLIFLQIRSNQAKRITLNLPLKLCDLAQLIGITPEHLSRVLKQAEDEGILHRAGGCLIVSDCQSLFQETDH